MGWKTSGLTGPWGVRPAQRKTEKVEKNLALASPSSFSLHPCSLSCFRLLIPSKIWYCLEGLFFTWLWLVYKSGQVWDYYVTSKARSSRVIQLLPDPPGTLTHGTRLLAKESQGDTTDRCFSQQPSWGPSWQPASTPDMWMKKPSRWLQLQPPSDSNHRRHPKREPATWAQWTLRTMKDNNKMIAILFVCLFLTAPCILWDLRSPTGDWTCALGSDSAES